MPTYSIPFDISDAPAGTQSFAVVLEDKDAITASGFVWTHWLIADLQRTICCRKRKPARYRLCSRGEQLGERAGQTRHRRSLLLRRHGPAQLPPPLRTDCLCPRHQTEPAARVPLQRPALRHAGAHPRQCRRNGYLRRVNPYNMQKSRLKICLFRRPVLRTPDVFQTQKFLRQPTAVSA